MAIAGVVVLLGLSGCGDDGDSEQSSTGVQAQDFRFAPATVRVPAGTSVEWRNTGRTDHTVKGPGFFSRAVPAGGRFAHRFAKSGSYEYLCTLHPDTMRGRVVVGG